MPASFAEHEVILSGACQVEDAERLRAWLATHRKAAVRLGPLTYLHTAVLQVLMAAQVSVREWPADAGLADDLAIILGRGSDAGTAADDQAHGRCANSA